MAEIDRIPSTNGESTLSNAVSASGDRMNNSGGDNKLRNGKKTKRKKKRPIKLNRSEYNERSPTDKSALAGTTYISKRKRNGRLVRLVSIDTKDNREQAPPTSASISTTSPPLPRNQYTTTLRRRAIRKLEENDTSGDCEECGDISLGMKLIVAGGRVIVQSLNSLSDGLASPAQLAGVVQRGDVLLAIGNLSLANLPFNQLMEGLSPLSTPDSRGFYERSLDLRFEAGAGFALLALHEQELAITQNNMNSMALFPMVDQLSGTPLFDPQYDIGTYQDEKFIADGNADENATAAVEEAKDTFPGDEEVLISGKSLDGVIDNFSLNLDSLISATLAKERNSDRQRYESEYFDWREDMSDLLRTAIRMREYHKNDMGKMLTKVERLELGRRVMKIAKVLELNIEEIDKGRDVISLKNYSSNISARSGSSTIAKRQYNMDGTITSFHSNYDNTLDGAIDEESIDSDGSLDDIDSDKLLLSLAARDAIWRKLVVAVLEKAAEDIKNSREDESKESSPPNGDFDIKQHLGNFLFRDANRIQKSQSESSAFPPQEITRVLFNLATFIATSAHDDITVFGASSKISSGISSRRSGATGLRGRASVRGDMLLAKRFILDEAIPHWLHSFQPIPLDQRRTLWPRQNSRADSLPRSEYTENSSDIDSVTLDSEGSRKPVLNAAQRKKKDSKEAGIYPVLDHENELKSETCFLVTYFCTEKIIGSDGYDNLGTIDRNSYIQAYGAYLQLQTSLSFASFVQDEVAISDILKVARDDPNHNDAMKDIEKSNGLLFYDSRKLSAVLEYLNDIRFETDEGRRKGLLDLCVSGYPDIQPWQVRTACFSLSELGLDETREQCSYATMEEMYYSYLCHLLNPVDGHEAAREDLDLLKEFCEWSVGINSNREDKAERMKNFMDIASPTSDHHNCYRRDLMMLLELSSAIEDNNLSLDLVDEMIGNGKVLSNNETLRRVLRCIRKIGSDSLILCSSASKEKIGVGTLRRVLKLFEKMSTSDACLCRNFINIADEIFALLQQWKDLKGSSGDDANMYHLIDFVIKVSSVPTDVNRALLLWTSSHSGNSLFPRLEDLLHRGIDLAVSNGELSGTLLRLKHARTTFKELESTHDKDGETKTAGSIWESMGEGTASIEK